MNKQTFIGYLKQEVSKAGSQKELAKRLGVSGQYLSDVLHGRREPGEKLLRPMGLTRRVNYERTEEK